MRQDDIENWALDIIERVLNGQLVEDSRVELKSEWPKASKMTARKLAGHANAARGEPILWLIGLKERGREVCGVEVTEVSDWFNSVEANFDGLAPALTPVHVPYDGKTVTALHFDTDRRPFVVKNPFSTQEKGNVVTLEVPWRDANRTHSAKRDELIKLLNPVKKLPTLKLLSGGLNVPQSSMRSGGDHVWMNLNLEIYIEARDAEILTIPFHECSAMIKSCDSLDSYDCKHGRFLHPTSCEKPGERGQHMSHWRSSGFARIDGAGFIETMTCCFVPKELMEDQELEATLKVRLAGIDELVPITGRFVHKGHKKDLAAIWEFQA